MPVFKYHVHGKETPVDGAPIDGAPVDEVTLNIESDGAGYRVVIDEREYIVTVQKQDSQLMAFTANGERQQVVLTSRSQSGKRQLWFDGDGWTLERVTSRQGRQRSGRFDGGTTLNASMPGQVINVMANIGDQVLRGDPLIVLEAMKMEMQLVAPATGKVQAIHVETGQTVERDELLVEIELMESET